MPGNSATVSIAIEVDDKGSVKIRQLGEAARKAGDEGARGFDAMGKSAGTAERGINTMSTTLKTMGAVAGAVAASAIIQQIVQIGSASLKAASDMEETQGKFNVVFQGMTAQAEAWAGELRALQRGGYPFRRDDLSLEEWVDLGNLARALEPGPSCPLAARGVQSC